jgi:hypothetical protein
VGRSEKCEVRKALVTGGCEPQMEGMDADDGWVRGADTWTGLNGAEIRR